ncbi:MAG: hypothetical protein ACREDY_20410 [Bradyrhizobium sp.]
MSTIKDDLERQIAELDRKISDHEYAIRERQSMIEDLYWKIDEIQAQIRAIPEGAAVDELAAAARDPRQIALPL